MKKTPLHAQHIGLGARMGEFGGWDMPIQYAGILQEHGHTRTKASVFDICHMGEFELSSATALQDLEKLLTCTVQSLEIGQVRYGFMLNDDGGTIDDLTCYRLAADRFMLVVNAGTADKDAEWIKSRISPGTRFADLSPDVSKLDLQGPKSREVFEDVFGTKLPDLGYFRCVEFNDWLISRTGYTGEWGYEIYLPNAEVAEVWDKLVAHDLCESGGLGARDTLRLEMGYPLYGHELSKSRTPVATSRGAFIDMQKDFIGKENVAAALDDPEELLVGLKFGSKRAAREHDKVYYENIEIGEVTSGSVAPSLDVAVAMAFVEPGFAEVGRELQVEIRGRKFPAEVVDLPFYKEGTARG
ncbi:MAG: glycine cleavage system aminomethyltransferase GcvT [Verrucomicrobiota bacterium]